MKKCPFCAESIQDEAIKCKHCGSMVSAAPPAPAAAAAAAPASTAVPAPAPPAATAPASAPPVAPAPADPVAALRSTASSPDERRILYAGSPSWRAFFATYFLVVLGTLVVPLIAQWIAAKLGVSTTTRVLSVIIPVALGVVAFFAIGFWRKSTIFRVSTTNIEHESGLLSKKIDVLELWRCRDVRYKQAISDRLLGIAHIEIYTTDVTSPQMEILGFPASRQLFEQIRDSIEIQRQHRNVVGFVQ